MCSSSRHMSNIVILMISTNSKYDSRFSLTTMGYPFDHYFMSMFSTLYYFCLCTFPPLSTWALYCFWYFVDVFAFFVIQTHCVSFGIWGPQSEPINSSQLAKMKKRVFLTCPGHETYRDEAHGLKSCKYILKITIFLNMWNLGQFRENLIFCQ